MDIGQHSVLGWQCTKRKKGKKKMYKSRVDETITFQTIDELRAAQAEAIANGDEYLRNKLFEMTWIDDPATSE